MSLFIKLYLSSSAQKTGVTSGQQLLYLVDIIVQYSIKY